MKASTKATAAFILREAEAIGYAFATNSRELVIKEPNNVSCEVRCGFSRAIAEYRIEIMTLILAELWRAIRQKQIDRRGCPTQ